MPNAGFIGVAGGDINPCRFVNLSAAANKTVLEADSAERTFGIAQEGTQDAPIPGASTLAAAAGDQVRVFMPGEFCLLLIGSGGCVAGDQLGSDADGKGIIVTANTKWVGATALETCSEGEKCYVRVESYIIAA